MFDLEKCYYSSRLYQSRSCGFQDAELPNIKGVIVEENLVRRSLKLQNFWKASPYYLEETKSKSEY